ncbi:uncharacterized protein LOC143293401 isoform X2 [Babylonia areolata]|uniref:uncharacterized protein LOC143293401 isoform X2 n=1 Tax=Babylonia areolata TaxID=304850 RepID=UPI003FD44E5F
MIAGDICDRPPPFWSTLSADCPRLITMAQDASIVRHQSYNNRFRTSSSGGGENTTTPTPTSPASAIPFKVPGVSEELDSFGHATSFGKLTADDAGGQKQPGEQVPECCYTTSQERGRSCSEITLPLGLTSPVGLPESHTDAAEDDGSVPVPTAPGKPRRLSRQTSAGAKRHNFAASRSTSGGANGNSSSVDSTRDDVFVELDVEGASYLHHHQQQQQQQKHVLYDSSLFPKRRTEAILSTSSSSASVLPNPYNHFNHRVHDAVWLCSCLYMVFFCCLPAIHCMERSDVEFRLDNQKEARRLGRASSVLFLVGTLLALLFFSLLFFLVIYFTTAAR